MSSKGNNPSKLSLFPDSWLLYPQSRFSRSFWSFPKACIWLCVARLNPHGHPHRQRQDVDDQWRMVRIPLHPAIRQEPCYESTRSGSSGTHDLNRCRLNRSAIRERRTSCLAFRAMAEVDPRREWLSSMPIQGQSILMPESRRSSQSRDSQT
ncbi:hypothetical protein Q31b_26550 [Novipirellula aureliae]|uniref:Uncharacterized protein n=1 Tax=Novipirellula aureliae TaxID=2527966 RepID=A0A5C6E1G3_9BACT|nr:hypothetical protein Q31b_26550 [Novipirellula aureliae]